MSMFDHFRILFWQSEIDFHVRSRPRNGHRNIACGQQSVRRSAFTSFRILICAAKSRSNLEFKYMRPVKLDPWNFLDPEHGRSPMPTRDGPGPGSSGPRSQHSLRVLKVLI